jgi:hypothetical protein
LRVLDLGGTAAGWRTHCLAPVGDMDGDGVRDYVVVMHDNGSPWIRQRLHVRSGRDDRLVHELEPPEPSPITWAIALLGDIDLDGDRRPDLVFTDPRWAPPRSSTVGKVYAYSNSGQ